MVLHRSIRLSIAKIDRIPPEQVRRSTTSRLDGVWTPSSAEHDPQDVMASE